MNLDVLHNYLLIINIAGCVLYLINMLLYKFTADAQIDSVITIVSLLGGSIGVLIPLLIFNRKIDKSHEDTIMSTVFLYCTIPIQIIIYIIIRNGVLEVPLSKLQNFLDKNLWFLIYLAIINIVTFIVYGLDKFLAIKEKSRVKIITLLILAFLGGELGGLLAMKIFHHKTNKDYFSVGLPLILLMHIVILFYFIFIR